MKMEMEIVFNFIFMYIYVLQAHGVSLITGSENIVINLISYSCRGRICHIITCDQ